MWIREKSIFKEEYQKHNRWTVKELEYMCQEAGFQTIEVKPVEEYWFSYIGKKEGY